MTIDNTTEIGWELYRSFLGVLDAGSLSGAARAMGIAQPTVGRHVVSLEKALGVTLFTRSQTGLLPTEAALALQPLAQAMQRAATALQRAAKSQGSGIQGTVRVTASEVIGQEVLPPLLAQLQDTYPDLTVELVLTSRVQDLLQREADIAVRMTQPRQEQLIARRVGVIPLGLHAHKRYLEKHGTPASLADLTQHALIGFDEETPFVRAARKAFPIWSRENFALRTDNDMAQMALIRAGYGIGVCQVNLAAREPNLVNILPGSIPLSLETWITMHEDLRNNPSCKVTFDALLTGLKSYIAS
ncbi:LysR family transcriptional regulator [Comamonas sp. B21-038]|uniref:LysR family transcriptional regulator n=1 Tax=Comamonas sp. B21-038 TaxID=2918299 RepID=UPI001EFA8AEF|nr:LysR family transcriptional regulator [Comamonas sp. B21-038]ULR91388.1 LysR family transcriptional regulator [Comamonas sp. B21-038]